MPAAVDLISLGGGTLSGGLLVYPGNILRVRQIDHVGHVDHVDHQI